MIKLVINILGAIVLTAGLIYFLVFAFEDGRLVIRQRSDAEKAQLLKRFQIAPTPAQTRPVEAKKAPADAPRPSSTPDAKRPAQGKPAASERNLDRKGLEKILEDAK